jgi:hypothetical protein
VNRLRQFWHYVEKVFDLPRRLRAVGDERSQPQIPTPVLSASLLLGTVLRIPSLLQLQSETARPGWGRLLGWSGAISDDAFCYVLERYRLEDWRSVLVGVNRQLKINKAFESAKISGLLVVSIDGNEQFKSRKRCCSQCSQRRVEYKDEAGQIRSGVEYYHRQVYAQLHGPDFSVILDIEPIRPGEDEAGAAVRMLGRMRRLYGPRFFDVVTVDAWYASGSFIRAVQRLGWAVVSVLKQERFEVYQEATTLSHQQKPQSMRREDREVDLWEVKGLEFTEQPIGPVRVVLAQEQWVEVQRQAGRTVRLPQQRHWRWLVSRELDQYGASVIWRIGHQRWGVENHAFNELTQHYHLTHCLHHSPVAVVAWLLILVLGFNLFELFARIHGKLCRRGRTTLQEIARQLDRALEAIAELRPLWSG